MNSSDQTEESSQMSLLQTLGTGLEEANATYEGTATVDGHETHVLEHHGETADNTTTMVYLDAENYLPRKIVSESSWDGETMRSTTTLSDISINCVSEDKFTLDAPEDTEVIDMTGDDSENSDDSAGDSESDQSDNWDDCTDDAKEGDDNSDWSDGDSDSDGA
ncbi:DUF2092 domain-containing protein [Haladaptatus sp. DFWS20]|uniref:DUF2092 domain-containing protein n=1 Tax=Haladaptatus sp. DFWS20 TaxID=3403467 RepID=UPI003EBA1584